MCIIKSFVAGICAITLSFATCAQGFPDKPIRFVVPYAPGGSGDVVGRLIGAKLTEQWKQQILIDNRAGAGGAIGASAVMQAPPDGYTLFLADDSVLSINPHLQKPKNPQAALKSDFVGVVPIALINFMLVVHPSVPASNLKEFIAWAKAHPGRYSYASAGIGSVHHLSMEWLKSLAGIDLVHVPYKGGGQFVADVIGGQIPVGYSGFSGVAAYVQAGKLKAIAIGGPAREPSMPNVATIGETFPGFNGTASWALYASAGTPRDVIEKLNAGVNKALQDPDLAKELTARGLRPLGGSTAAFEAKMKSDYENWGKLVEAVGLRAD